MKPSLSEEIEAGLAAIAADRGKGAAELARDGLSLLAKAVDAGDDRPQDETLAAVEALAGRLSELRPSMAAIANWAVTFADALEAHLKRPDAEREAAPGAAVLARLLAEGRAMAARQSEAARPLLKGARSVLTLSYSSTVERLLVDAAPAGCRVVVAEGRPLFEGRRLTLSLERAGRAVTSITDAQIGLFVEESDLLILGADTVTRDLAAVNKAGSRLAALAARAARRPCLVAADTFKINPFLDTAHIELEEMDGREVWPERPDLAANLYFEVVPARLIDLFVTEKGALDRRAMRREVTSWRRRRARRGRDAPVGH